MDSLGPAGPVVYVLASAVAVIAFPLVPGGLLVVAAPVLFGPVEVTILSYLGVCAGSLAAFALARRHGVGLIGRLVGPRALGAMRDRLSGPRATGAFALAIVLPIAPVDLLCYLVGTTRMRACTFTPDHPARQAGRPDRLRARHEHPAAAPASLVRRPR